MTILPTNPFSLFKDPSVLPTIHPLVEFLRGWLILNLENIHSRTTAPTSVNTFVQTPRNCQFLTRLREIRSQTFPNGDDLVNYTFAPLIRPLSPNSKWWSSYKSKGSLINSDALNISSQFYFWYIYIWFVTVQWLDFERVPVLKTLWPNRAGKTLIYSPPLNQDRTRLYAFSY